MHLWEEICRECGDYHYEETALDEEMWCDKLDTWCSAKAVVRCGQKPVVALNRTVNESDLGIEDALIQIAATMPDREDKHFVYEVLTHMADGECDCDINECRPCKAKKILKRFHDDARTLIEEIAGI